MVMDISLYHDNGHITMKSMKSKLTLDFAAPPAKKTHTQMLGVNHTSVLASPDLQMLKLASPELERLIIQHNDMVTTTPTPTSVHYPRNVTEEQEAYARGFIDALAELHKKQDLTVATTDASEEIVGSDNGHTAPLAQPLVVNTDGPLLNAEPIIAYTSIMSSSVVPQHTMTTTTSLPVMTSMPMGSVPLPINQNSITSDDSRTSSPLYAGDTHIKEEPQTVPVMNLIPPTNITPINMGDQEVFKVERKRARNRQAARKCRTRKLERISRLEERVKNLKDQNSELVSNAQTLREQVCQLKKQILHHVTSGCKVMLTHNNL